MMIDDEELRSIFKTASEEHLQQLEAGLLYLEQHPFDRTRLEDLLREAHSLKGDANMLGVRDVGTLAHQIEDVLGTIKHGKLTLAAVSDRLYYGLDAIRKLVHESVTGEPVDVNAFHVLAHLMGVLELETPPTVVAEAVDDPEANNSETALAVSSIGALDNSAQPSISTDISTESTPEVLNGHLLAPEASRESGEPNVNADINATNSNSLNVEELPPLRAEDVVFGELIADEPVESTREQTTLAQEFPQLDTATPPTNLPKAPAIADASDAGSYRIETIRVETQKLDALMTQTGELTVTKIRVAHRLSEIEAIASLWEEWSRDAFVNRFAFSTGDRRTNQSALNQLQTFYHRTEERLDRLGLLINRLRSTAYEDNARLDVVASELEEGVRTLRLLPLSTIFQLMPRMVRDLAKQQGKEINLVIEGGETRADKRVLEEMKDPLMHMVRNAIDHGLESPTERESQGKPRQATIRLKGYQTATSIVIEVSDDGRGLDIESIKQTALKREVVREADLVAMTSSQIQSLIFAPGFSTRTFVTEISGRGVGLDVVRTNVERLKGTIQVESQLGQGCAFRVQMGTTLSTAHVLIVEVQGRSYAIPVEAVHTTLLVQPHEVFAIEGRETIILADQPVSIVELANLLELESSQPKRSQSPGLNSKLLPCIVLKIGSDRLGLLVDSLLDEQDVVLKPQSKLLKRVRNVSGATILGTGEVCMVLNPHDLIKSVRQRANTLAPKVFAEAQAPKQTVLLVEDSITIRTQEKRILESAGYEVVTAVDGLDGFNKLRTREFDAVVSDIQMPNLDGLGLTAKIRQHKEYSELPIILVTSLATDDDKRRGAEAGANAYIAKGTFDQKVLLDTLRRLV
ncbi:MAG: hybrid sensor histidine kinase/response regulator [Trichocoleus desertorum ATA4-8-CV12]|jgi:two-component system chemotaxis sensor kinase CheA|nr:hybrid sensor histidine kinase/response regulator [Trichocoleus desertorum ATA4-8-CV12]